MKTPVIHNNEYTVYLENDFGFTFIHCDCVKWTKEIKKALIDDIEKLLKIHRKEVYAIHEIIDEKHKKFLRIVGFDYLSDFAGSDGIIRQIFVRRI